MCDVSFVSKPTAETAFDCSLDGQLGCFGGGMGIVISYAQVILCFDDLKKLTLAEELPGSEHWPIRDLFQRDVDHKRVQNQIVPWLRDNQKIKFFPPLTLALLPKTGDQRLRETVPSVDMKCTTRIGSASTQSVSCPPYFEFSLTQPNEVFRGNGKIRWNSDHCYLVALDGQHRLAALRELAKLQPRANAPEISSWSIPAAIVGATANASETVGDAPLQLDLARAIFVYINTQSQNPSRARQVLLNDELPSAMLAQALVERAHTRSDPTLAAGGNPPIAAITWRDANTQFSDDEHRLFDIVEMQDWAAAILLVPPGSGAIGILHGVLDVKPNDEAYRWLANHPVTQNQKRNCQAFVARHIVPPIETLLSQLQPFQLYYEQIAVIKSKRLIGQGTDTKADVLFRLGGRPSSENAINETALAREWCALARDRRREIPELFRHRIGMRGVLSGWLQLAGESCVKVDDLQAFTENYCDALNRSFENGWLVNTTKDTPDRYLKHITKKPDGEVKNYRFEDVGPALGSLCALLAAVRMYANDGAILSRLIKYFGRGQLYETIRGGYVGELKRTLKASNPTWTAGEIKDRAQSQSKQLARRQIDLILAEVGLDPLDHA